MIVPDGQVVGEGHDEVGIRHDPSAHVEIVAIRQACESLERDALHGATLCSTLPPCGIGSIGPIVCGAKRRDVHGMYFEERHLDVPDIIAAT